MIPRTVILHYHLFKNAGTSFDGILQRNFPGRWATAEFRGPGIAGQVGDWIAATPGAVAFSSHTATGPLPRVPGVRVISCLFLRDPLARIRSAWAFERAQDPAGLADPRGTLLARETDLAGYVRARLAWPGDRQCRDFQTARLAAFAPGPGGEPDRAIAALPLLSFVGRVERFDADIARFAALARGTWPDFNAAALHLNRSPGEGPPPDPALAAVLEAANRQDRALIAAADRLLRTG